jgi:hypothetical protein
VEKSRKSVCLLIAMSSVFAFPHLSFAASLPAKASDYPSLSDKELGQVQWIIKLAQQPQGDWSYMGGLEEGQEGLEGYRYQLGYMTYALALAQYHKTPAYRELYQKAIDNLIQKMIRRDVWYYWEHTSKGSKIMNPALKEKGPGWIDPVVEKNIMYSGHLINMVELYQMLYRDAKYDKPKAIAFRWEWAGELLDVFHYDGNKLAEVIHRQFIQNPLHMIECEVNMVFCVCNQPPLLGLILYDHNHGTNLASSVKGLMMKTFTSKGLLDSATQDFLLFYMIEQGMPMGPGSPGNNAFVGISMHAWNPEFIENLYRTHVKKIGGMADGTANVPLDNTVGVSSAPVFAAYAREVGDEKTASNILAWMEKNCFPKWIEGKYCYPRNDEKKITPLFNVMAVIAELNLKNGIWALYNQPWRDNYFNQPFVSGVEYPKAIVKQAYYDNKKDALAVTLLPGDKSVKNTSFLINQLNKDKVYSVSKNGQRIGYLKKAAFEPQKGIKGIEFSREGILKISTNLATGQTFLIQGEQ